MPFSSLGLSTSLLKALAVQNYTQPYPIQQEVIPAILDRYLLTHYLQRQGCRAYVGVDGQDAFQKAVAVQPDIILMDVRMPGCDGLTACRLLGDDARTRDIPVIFLTAAASPEERVEGLRAGAVDYIIKPFDFEEVRLRLVINHRDTSILE